MMTDEQIERAANRLVREHYRARAAALADVLAEIERFRNDQSGLDPLDLLRNRVAGMIGEAGRAAEQ